MRSLRSPVVGVDGSKASAAALAWAAERLRDDGVVHVVHAFEPPRGSALGLGGDVEAIRLRSEAELNGAWTDEARTITDHVHTHLVDDEPAHALLAVANDFQADIVIVGVHGAGRSRHFLGGATRKLLHNARLPVVVIDPEATEHDAATRRVVACVGYGKASDAAARWAVDYAAHTELPLTLLHVVGRRPVYPTASLADTIAAYFGPEVSLEWAALDLEALKADLHALRPNVPITTTVELGSTVGSIEGASRGAELVVLGKRQASPLSRGTIAPRIKQLVGRIAAPVAIVPFHRN